MEVTEKKRFVYEFGDYVLDAADISLLENGKPVHLTAKEFETLLMLVENGGNALSKEEMMSRLWQDAFVEEGNLAKQISRLRKRLDTNGSSHIETIPKYGYRFSADVQRVASAETEPIVIERKSVGRMTITHEDARSQTTVKRKRWLTPFVSVLAMTIAATAAYLAGYGPSGTNIERTDKADRYEAVRLTEDPQHDAGPRWTRDGRVRFFRFDEKGQPESFIMNADGTGQTLEKPFADFQYGTWSPDGQKVLFTKPDDPRKLYLANSDGLDETPVPFEPSNLDWSFDSKWLVYQQKIEKENTEIFLYSVDSKTVRNLTNSKAFDADPSFSPDGNSVVFVSDREGNSEIYVMHIADGIVRRLTNHPSVDSHPIFSPDGTHIVFCSDREKESADIFMMPADGSGPAVNLNRWTKSDETTSRGGWSPDGTKILFTSDRNGKEDIFVMSAEAVRPTLVRSRAGQNLTAPSVSPDGATLAYWEVNPDGAAVIRTYESTSGRELEIFKAEAAGTTPMWSPQGDRLIFSVRRNDNTDVFVIRPDGSDLINLSNDPAADGMPAWSPDGTQIAFVSNRGGNLAEFHVYVINADGSDPREVYHSGGMSSAPTWSPDGTEIVFSSDSIDEGGRNGNFELLSVRPGVSADSTRLTFRRRAESNPAFSPDGNRIAFVSNADGNSEIYIMNRDGSGLIRLTRNTAEDTSPQWSPDGTKIIFSSNRDGKSAIYELQFESPQSLIPAEDLILYKNRLFIRPWFHS